MKIFIASDHAGFELKQKLVEYIRQLRHEVVDKGPVEFNQEDDYPDFIFPLAKEVAADKTAHGIILGGSGQGEAICANRVSGIRAALYYGGPLEIIRLSREHNDANILSLGARFLNEESAKDAVRLWLDTQFSAQPRHIRRIEKIDKIEAEKK